MVAKQYVKQIFGGNLHPDALHSYSITSMCWIWGDSCLF